MSASRAIRLDGKRRRSSGGGAAGRGEADLAAQLQVRAQEDADLHERLTIQRLNAFLDGKPALAEHVLSMLRDGLITDPSAPKPVQSSVDTFLSSQNKLHLLPEPFVRGKMNKYYPDKADVWGKWKRPVLVTLVSNRTFVSPGSAIQSREVDKTAEWLDKHAEGPEAKAYGALGIHALPDGLPDWTKMAMFSLDKAAKEVCFVDGTRAPLTGSVLQMIDVISLEKCQSFQGAVLTDSDDVNKPVIEVYKKANIEIAVPHYAKEIAEPMRASGMSNSPSGATTLAPAAPAVPLGAVNVPAPPGGWNSAGA